MNEVPEVNEAVETAVVYKGYYCTVNGVVYAAPTAEELVKVVTGTASNSGVAYEAITGDAK